MTTAFRAPPAPTRTSNRPWSPDGSRLAFTRGSPESDAGDVYVTDLATGTLTQVASFPEYDHQVALGARWPAAGVRARLHHVFLDLHRERGRLPIGDSGGQLPSDLPRRAGFDSARSLALLGSLAATVWAAAAGRNYP